MLATVLAVVVGVPIGLVIGLVGGWLDRVVMRALEAMTALPAIVVLLAVISVLGPGLTNAMVALGLAMSGLFVRVVRAEVVGLREELFVDSARVMAVPTVRVVSRHVLPGVVPTLLVTIAIVAGTVLLAEAGLSFLGIGVQAPDASWGSMLTTAGTYVGRQPFLAVPPGAAIALSVLSFNILGDTIRDAFLRAPSQALRSSSAAITRTRRRPSEVLAPTEAVLDVHDLTIVTDGPLGISLPLVTGVDLSVARGEVLGLVGESGSGKTLTALAALGLLPSGVRIGGGTVRLAGLDTASLSDTELRRHRALHSGLVFQDATNSLDPTMTVGRQAGEALRLHGDCTARQAHARVVELLALVGIVDPERCSRSFPHQLSGGMAQRVAIAAALACEPDLLVADEPTTALDATVQEQVLSLFHRIRRELGTSILFVTHDLSIAADLCDRVAVLYAGEVVETSDVDHLFDAPRHPYSRALLDAHPLRARPAEPLPTIGGFVPPPGLWPVGCRFAPRCALREEACDVAPVELVDAVRCRRLVAAVGGNARR
jgi:peptide/nickel transport system permease protein